MAVLRWMVAYDDTTNTTFPLEAVQRGDLDMLRADTFNCTTGIYGGGPILPEYIAENIYDVLDRQNE